MDPAFWKVCWLMQDTLTSPRREVGRVGVQVTCRRVKWTLYPQVTRNLPTQFVTCLF